jgi:ATP-dependent Lon protease
MPKEAKEKAEAELQKLKMMSPMSAEATVVRGYIEWMVQVPWNARSKVKKDLRQAQEDPRYRPLWPGARQRPHP